MIFDKLFAKRATEPQTPDRSTGGFAMYRPSVSGENISADSALTFSAWWGCVRGISETIAYLPWNVMIQTGNKKEIASDHALQTILKFKPNEEMSAFTFKETALRTVLSRGNFYGEKERNRLGEVVNIWPIEYDRVNVDRDRSGRIIFDTTNANGSNTVLSSKDVFHLKGPGDGLVGLSVVELAKETIGLGIASEKFGGALFGNGAMPSLVITSDGSTKLNSEGVVNLLSTWNKRNQGSRNARKTEYLEKGFKVEPLSINPNDAQFLETRKFQVHEVCRWFRYPVHKLAELDRSTNNNIEAENISFVTDTLMPWIARLESEANISLFSRGDIGRFYSKINVSGILRGDLKARSEFYKAMWGLGVFSIDDILELEDRNPLPDGNGDLRMVPLNMVSVETAKKQGNTVQQKSKDASLSQFKLLSTIAQRFVTIETKRLKDLSGKATFKQDATKFYCNQIDAMTGAFTPAVIVVMDALGRKSDMAEAITAQFIQQLTLDSADTAEKAVNQGNIDSLLHSWSTKKAETIAEQLLNKVITNE